MGAVLTTRKLSPDYYFPLTLSTDYKIGVANSRCGRGQLIRGLAVDSYNYDGLNISQSIFNSKSIF